MKLSRLAFAVLLAAAACSKGGADADKKIKELSERIDKLEKDQQSFAEVAAFVKPIMDQQKAQEQAQAAQEPDPNTRFAIDVQGDAVDGPATAAVTVVEAFDFA